MYEEKRFQHISEHARTLGAEDTAIIKAEEIPVNKALAGMCKDPRCSSYGLSGKCPPHVEGPSMFREWQSIYSHAVVIKIDVPAELMFSSDRPDIMRVLHEIVSGVEIESVNAGFSRARAFAGGCCKNLFCSDHADCRVLKTGGTCRNQDQSRPSMSGFGIDVSKLMKAAKLPYHSDTRQTEGERPPLLTLCGLVLLL